MTTASTNTITKLTHLDHFIDGEFSPSTSGKTFETFNPATEEVLATVSLGTKEDIDRAVAAAKNAFENGPWPKMSLKERCTILKRIGDLIEKNKEQLARAESQNTGKPIRESLNGDIPRAALNFHFFADYAQSLSEESYRPNEFEQHFATRDPSGVCGLITPWNLPLYLATWKIAPALAMGNTCVLKPAEWTPYTATLLGKIVQEAGLPNGVLNIVHGFGADGAGEALTKHPDVACISFTGETTTGKAIMQAASQSLKKLSFELGGKGANIIFADADLDASIDTAINAAFRNAGQICLAGSRLYVQDSIFDKVVEALVAKAKKLRIGDPLDPQTEMGSVISKEQMDKIEKYIAIGKKEGKLQTGGNRPSSTSKGYFLEPTIFTNLSKDSPLCKEEIFGPVLPIVPFSSEAEVVAMANDTQYGLSASVWSSDVNRLWRVSRALRTGIVWVNCWFARDLRTPFGGQKASGIGREGGRYSLEFFSEAKTICYRYKA